MKPGYVYCETKCCSRPRTHGDTLCVVCRRERVDREMRSYFDAAVSVVWARVTLERERAETEFG